MIRTNLATRPFYNARGINLALALLALLVTAATVFNGTRVLKYSGSNTELMTQASQDESAAATMRRDAAALRGSVDARQIENASKEARQANDLIDRRTFSWTALFNRFEATIPDAVRITAVRPKPDRDRRITLTVVVLARTVGDVNQFMERLDETGAFRDLRSSEEHTTDDNQVESILEMVYLPNPDAPAPKAEGAAPNAVGQPRPAGALE
jgi:Tfp pilus assembly protein PilN